MVSSTKNIRKLIKESLEQLGVKAYYEMATQDAPFPYITYEFENIDVSDKARRDISLTINAWDKTSDSVNIEDLADAIEDKMHYQNFQTDDILLSSYCVSRLSLPDEDPLIKRRQISVVMKYYNIRSDNIVG